MIIKGDINGDGKIDFRDSDLLTAHMLGLEILTGDSFEAADINGDGLADVLDLAELKLHLLGVKIINEVIE